MQINSPIVILGAGLQGCGIALELAHRGHQVTLVDQDALPMNRASLRNEGKIHLGLIYAADSSFATAQLQLRGALSFHNLLKRWCGEAADTIPLSTPFDYLVASDSVLSSEQLSAHYERLDAAYRELVREQPSLNYMGQLPDRLFALRNSDQAARHFNIDSLAAVFQTAELAVDTEVMAEVIRRAILGNSNIRFLARRRVLSVNRISSGFRTEGSGAVGTWSIESEQVVNATWEGRFALDQSTGIDLAPGWLHRLKYRVIVKLPQQLLNAPSATMVLGRYGDVVVRPNGTAYLSWYPTGMRGWSHAIAPPEDWDGPCRGEPDAQIAAEVVEAALKNIEAWYPGIAQSTPIIVDAGAIVAYGKTDVDDYRSGLHDRTRVGVTSHDGYHSVDPGKLTTAPLFAVEATDAIVSWQRGVTRSLRSQAAPEPVKRPRVVALMPAWKAAAFIEPVLQALAAQTYPNLEILISDDASPDNTVDLCEQFAALHSNCRVIRQQKNLGWIGNVNALLQESDGDLYFFAFHDDVLAPEYVSKLVQALESNPEAIMAFSDLELTYQDGTQERCAFRDLSEAPVDRAMSMASRERNWWVPNRGIFHAGAARRIGGVKRHWRGEMTADWPWLLHMAVLGQFVRVPEILCYKEYMPGSLSKSWKRGIPDWISVTLSCAREIHHSDLQPMAKAQVYTCLARGISERIKHAFILRWRRVRAVAVGWAR
jgi:glycosyltransferase involved in cell wall biosynthesis/glycine/D-amino acid oxidase-like deaminating enzyme